MTATRDILDQYQNAIASALQRKTPLKIRGGGTKDFYGNPVSGEILDTRAYSGIVNYDPAELVITARCGTPLAEIEQALGAKNQMLAFEPPYFGSAATLGGTIATGLSGPRRAHAGAVRDFMLGVKILNGLGEELNFGGRVMKNVAGYDVSRLMTGSMGTLGVLLEASLKVFPKPKMETSLCFEMFVTTAVETINRWIGSGIPITASCHVDNVLTIRLSGSDNVLSGIKQKLGGDEIDMPEQFWNSIKEQSHEFFKTNSKLRKLAGFRVKTIKM